MTVAIDDLLVVFAAEAGKAAGTEIAKGLIKFLTEKLATREDLGKAVREIQNYIHQEFQVIEARAIVVDVDTAILNLEQYQRSGHMLEGTQQLLNRARSEIKAAIAGDPDYVWKHYVAVVRYTAVSTAFWAATVFNEKKKNEARNLIDAIVTARSLLRDCLAAIHTKEDETISLLDVERNIFQEYPTPDSPGSIYYNYRSWYDLARGRYSGGRVRHMSKWHVEEQQALRAMQPSYAADTARIAEESAQREAAAYKPLVECIDSLDNMLLKLNGKTEKEFLASYGME